MRTAALVLSLAALTLGGCGPKLIPGLDIELADTPDHRALVQLMADFRAAYEKMDAAALQALASPRFFEDSGTPETDDDYAYEGIQTFFSKHFQQVKRIQLDLQIKDVGVEGDQAHVDYRYVTRYLMSLPVGEKWQVTDELNRMELVRENNVWKVISGM